MLPQVQVLDERSFLAALSLVFEQEIQNLPEEFCAWLRAQGRVDVATGILFRRNRRGRAFF